VKRVDREATREDAPAALDVAKLRALLPHVGTAGLEEADATAPPRSGKLLKLKLGFNPNSSSVGTTVVVFLWSLVASGAVLAFTAAVLAHRFQRRRPSAAAEPESGA
jgi:hypothetical protein